MAFVRKAGASRQRLTEGQVETSATSAASVSSVPLIHLMMSALKYETPAVLLPTESNLSCCGFRGSSHIGIPYSTKVPIFEP